MTVEEIIAFVTGWGSYYSGDNDSSRDEIDATQAEINRVVDAIRDLERRALAKDKGEPS